MAKTKVVINDEGIRDLLRGEEVAVYLERIADDAVQQLGDGYSRNTYVGANRLNVEITADTEAAHRDVLQNNTIIRALL